MGEGVARAIAIGSIVLTVASLTLAVFMARKQTRIRMPFDVARAVVGVAAIVVMASVARITTPVLAILVAVAVGLGLGFAQGSTLEVSRRSLGLYAKRSPIGVVLWGAGIIVIQIAGIASRTNLVRLGQTVAWFSACLGIGLMVGRAGPMRRAAATAGAVALAGIMAFPLVALVGDRAEPARAQTELSDDDVCALTPDNRSANPGDDSGWALGVALTPIDSALAVCTSLDYYEYTGIEHLIVVYLFGSPDEARSQFSAEVAAAGQWWLDWRANAAGLDETYDPTLDYNRGTLDEFGMEGAWFSVNGAEDRVVALEGRFLLYGLAQNTAYELGEIDDTGFRRPTTLIDEVIVDMTAIADNIRALEPTDGTDPGGTDPGGTDPGGTDPGGTDPGGTDTDRDDTPTTTDDAESDEPIEPEEAAAQAIAGAIAAAAIGAITWAEAAAEISRVVDRLPPSGPAPPPTPTEPAPPPTPTGPFIDPLDNKPLDVDPATGMVFWPWDGKDGHWVEPSEMPALLDDWNRELDAETARRVAGHTAQRERNWRDLQDRIRRSDLEDAARQAEAQARLDDFDRRLAAAEEWMEESDPDSLGRIDRIRQQVADQGFVTDEDMARAGRIADRARVWADTKDRWDAEDWARIERNKATVVEVAAKGAAIMLDPTKGAASGFIFGWTESRARGEDAVTALGNGAFDATIFRTTHAVGTWAPGRAAVGKIGWGAASGSASAAGETLIRGGSLEDAAVAAQVGFVTGGMGGAAEELSTIGTTRPTAPTTPTIRTRPGGPRVGYDAPPKPALAPPERGGVSMSDPDVPRIEVEPGGPGVYYDEPLDPVRHIDPDDPRYVSTDPRRPAPGTPVLDPDSGPRPPVTPEPPPRGLEPGDIDLPPSPREPVANAPATPEQLLPTARPTRPSSEILDEMMQQPRHPSGPGPRRPAVVEDWQRGFFPDADGRTLIDADGKVVVGDRHIGNVDPETGGLVNLDGEPMAVTVDHRGIPNGYVEQPNVPAGMQPAYNARGELAGYVDGAGRANIDGEMVPVAFDAKGKLVPYDAPPRPGPPVEHLPPEQLRGQSRLPGAEPSTSQLAEPPPAPPRPDPSTATGEVAGPPAAADGPVDYSPYGQPIQGADGAPPASLSDLDTGPRIPVLDENGRMSHLVEPGPREIRFDENGNPFFVQREHPVTSTPMGDIDIDTLRSTPGGRPMPTPEVFDATEAWYPLAGEGAPSPAPALVPTPPGGSPS